MSICAVKFPPRKASVYTLGKPQLNQRTLETECYTLVGRECTTS